MLFLAKIAGVAVLVWFYLTAQQHKEPPVKWAIIGGIGYLIAWFLVYKILILILPAAITKTAVMGFVVMQVPALCAMVAAYLIRTKLVHDAVANSQAVGQQNSLEEQP